jgi:cupin fold WbuC family metalloprotein
MQVIDVKLLDSVTAQAKKSPRLRMNYNFHESSEAKSQRLLNALEPDTIMPVHRHLHTDETYIVLRGKIKVTFYNKQKEATESTFLGPTLGIYGLNIPKGQWHSLEVLEQKTVIFETKDGPYTPLSREDIL